MKDKKAPDWKDKSLIEIVSNGLYFLLRHDIINAEEFGVISDRVNSWIDYHVLGVDTRYLNDFAKQKPPSEDNVRYCWIDHSLEFRLEQTLQTLGTLGFVTDAEFLLILERIRQFKDRL